LSPRGCTILGQKARLAAGEPGLIARRGPLLVFCKVKMRSSTSLVSPVAAVGEDKLRRLQNTAETWLVDRRDLAGLKIAFELAAVTGRRVEYHRLLPV
jgi:putative endonuclease